MLLDHARHQAWGRYLEANARLAQAIARARPSPRAFLVQDYHLYPLPALLREHFPTTPILHFTHIPFPDTSLLRLLPAAAGYLREGSVPDIAVQRELPAEFRRATRWGMLTGPAAYIRSARRQARVAAEAQQEAPR